MALIKLYALFTIRKQRWLTRQVAVEDGAGRAHRAAGRGDHVRALGARADAGGGGTVRRTDANERRARDHESISRMVDLGPAGAGRGPERRAAGRGAVRGRRGRPAEPGRAPGSPSPIPAAPSRQSGSGGSGSGAAERAQARRSAGRGAGAGRQARARARAAAAAAAARAERAQQQAAAAAQRGQASWESHGRPNKMIIVRAHLGGLVDQRRGDPADAARGRRADRWPAWTPRCPAAGSPTDDGTLRLAAARGALARGHPGPRRRRRHAPCSWPAGATAADAASDLHRQRPAERARRRP